MTEQFGDSTQNAVFVLSSFLLGSGVLGGTNVGDAAVGEANKMYEKLTPEEKLYVDAGVRLDTEDKRGDMLDALAVTAPDMDKPTKEAAIKGLTDVQAKLATVDGSGEYKIEGEVDGNKIVLEGNGVEDLDNAKDFVDTALNIYKDKLDADPNETVETLTGQTETPTITQETVVEQPSEERGADTEIDVDTTNVDTQIADLRAQEQADLAAAIPNIDEYKVDGEIDRDAILASPDADKYNEIYDRYNAPITALFEQGKKEGVTEPIQAPAIKAQVVGTTNGFNTIIDGGLGKQQDPRFTGEVQQGKSIFKVQPNNNESSFLDISLPSYDSFGRSGGIQIRFELPNGVDANTVFEAVKKEAAKVGSLDAKDPNFKQTVQGLVDKGIAEIQGLATGGAGQTAQVKPAEKQMPPTTTSENPALKNVQSTATALSKIDKSIIDATLPMQALEIDGYKREYRNDSPVSIAEAYHKAKADKSNPDLVKAVEELLAPNTNEQKAAESTTTATVDTGTIADAGTGKAGEIDDDAFFAGKVKKKKVRKADIDKVEGNVDLDEVMSLFEDAEYQERYDAAVDEENNRIAAEVTDELTFDTGTQGVLSVKEAAIHAAFKRVDPDSFKRFGDRKNLKGKKIDKTNQVLNLQLLLKKGGKTIDQIAQEATGKLSKDFTNAITTDDVYEYMMSRAENPNRFKNKYQKAADVIRKGKVGKDGVAMSGVIPPPIWNAAIEGVARAVELTGDFVYATNAAVTYIKQTDWYKKATTQEQNKAVQDVKDFVKQSIPKEETQETAIPEDVIEELLKGSNKRADALKELSPELESTARNITGVGFAKFKQILANEDGAFDKQLAQLEKKLGMKKIC
jgi:hypothetical protein